MKKFTLSVLVTFALCAATAVAQQRSSPTGQANSQQQQQQPGMHQPGAVPDQTSPTAQTDQNTANENHSATTEKTLKGCVESQGGQYVLETKKGSVSLMGQDVSAHVGHEVKVKGTWEKASASNAGAAGTAESSANAAAKSFNVSSVDMVSETCKMKSKGSSSGTGTGTGTSNQPQ